MLSNISTKLIALVVFMTAALFAFAGYTVVSLSQVAKQVDHIAATETPISQSAFKVVEAQLQQELALHVAISVSGQGAATSAKATSPSTRSSRRRSRRS